MDTQLMWIDHGHDLARLFDVIKDGIETWGLDSLADR